MEKRRIIIWTTNIDQLILEKGAVGGLTVQMYFWAKTFIQNGWSCYSFSKKQKQKLEDINFINYFEYRYINIIINFFYTPYIILKIKPNVILLRGAGRSLFLVQLFAWLIKCKIVFFAASDLDFTLKHPEQRLYDRIMFKWALKRNSYFVVQNEFQQTLLDKKVLDKKSIVIPNIWLTQSMVKNVSTKYKDCILWVGNFRELKRPMWFIELASKNPDYSFVMIGSATDRELFKQCAEEANKMPNLYFLGRQSFNYVNGLFKQAKFFVCTSEVEGFPNTFLQAWSNSVPVISTVDPSNVIKMNHLGYIVNNQEELIEFLLKRTDKEYRNLQTNIDHYFYKNHEAQSAYNKLIELIS